MRLLNPNWGIKVKKRKKKITQRLLVFSLIWDEILLLQVDIIYVYFFERTYFNFIAVIFI